MKTSVGAFGVGAIGRSRPIRAGILNDTVFCAASGDPVPVRTRTFDVDAGQSVFADLFGSVQARAEGGDFVFRLIVAGATVQTKRLPCPAESFSTSASGFNTTSGTLTARAAILSGTATHFEAQCTYTATAASVRVSRVKPANVFAAFGSSFYPKSALNDSELRNACSGVYAPDTELQRAVHREHSERHAARRCRRVHPDLHQQLRHTLSKTRAGGGVRASANPPRSSPHASCALGGEPHVRWGMQARHQS
jgi:hypothetical protein